MDLIDFQHQFFQIKSVIQQNKQQLSAEQVFSELFIKQIKQQLKSTTFSCLLKKIQGNNIIGKLIFRQSGLLLTRASLSLSNYFKTITKNQKLSLLKYFLKINSEQKKISFKINFESGDICAQISLQYPQNTKKNTSLLGNFLLILLSIITQQVQKKWSQVLFIANRQLQSSQQINFEAQKHFKLAKELKSFCNSSSHYAWNICDNYSRSSLKNDQEIYKDKKSQFKKFKLGAIKYNNKIKALSKCFNFDKPNIFPQFNLTVSDDQELKQKYLTGINVVIKNYKILNEVQLSQKQADEFIKNNKLIINSPNNDLIQLQKNNSAQKQIDHIKFILKKLPCYQFSGLPKFYTIKNRSQFGLQNSLFTNLRETRTLKQYVDSNNKTLSINTKLWMLTQISNSLMYLRNHKILYHNLSPNTVSIKKGMKIKLNDLTNSMHPEITKSKKFSKREFPYVQNFEKIKLTYLYDQRSDSFSFGILMNQILFNKTSFGIKNSTSMNFSELDKIQKLLQLQKLSNQFLRDYGSYQMIPLYNFLQQAMKFNASTEEYQQLDQFEIQMKGRPYLDWFSIVSKHLLANL